MILLIAYHFPPTGGAGVQRSLKFVQYLPAFGVRPLVLTRAPGARDRWTHEDATLLSEVAGDAGVFRIDHPEPAAPRGVPATLERALFLRSRWHRWWSREVQTVARQIIGQHPISVIVASMSPYETGRAASLVSDEFNLPWVADLRDPWALDEMHVYPSVVHRRLDAALMRRSLRTAAAIIMNTLEARRALLDAFPDLAAKRIAVIPNGYDSMDFTGSPPAASSAFTIVHTGYLHTEPGLQHRRRRLKRLFGGELMDTDILTRSHYFLLQAIREWLRVAPTEAASVRIILAGPTSVADRRVVREAGLESCVEFRGPVSHGESVQLLRTASVLFLPMHNLPEGRRARIVPAKTYEYLAAGRPILAAVPDGDACDLLRRSGRAIVCRPNDVRAMLTALRELFLEWRAGQFRALPGTPILEAFERKRLAGELADLLEKVAVEFSSSSSSSGMRSR